MKKSKRLFAILLALAMIVTFMPAMAFAEEDNNQTFDVGEEVFYAGGDLNSHRAVPGMSLTLKAIVNDWAWDEEVREKDFTYSWELKGVDELRYWVDSEEEGGEGYEEELTGYDADDFVAITGNEQTVSAAFRSKAAVEEGKSDEEKAKIESAYERGFGVSFEVTATRDGESHDREFNIWVSNDYYEVEPVENPFERVVFGESVTIEPKLFHVTGVNEKTEVNENVEWKFSALLH